MRDRQVSLKFIMSFIKIVLLFLLWNGQLQQFFHNQVWIKRVAIKQSASLMFDGLKFRVVRAIQR